MEYSRCILLPSVSHNIIKSPPPPDDEDATFRSVDPSSLDHNTPSTSHSCQQKLGQSNNRDVGNFTAGRSMELEALYTTELVKEAFMRLINCDISGFIFLDSDDGSNDDEAWEDNMDPFTFARYYAGPSNPHFVKMVQDYDHETHTCFKGEMKSWAKGVVSADPEFSAY